MKKYILIAILTISGGTLASCSAWDLIKPSSGLSVDTELVVGDKVQTVNSEIGTTNNKADSIVQNIDNTDYIMLGALLTSVITGVVGWMLPVPKFMRK